MPKRKSVKPKTISREDKAALREIKQAMETPLDELRPYLQQDVPTRTPL